MSDTINIEPGTSIYEVFRRLSYTPNGAVAEFIDNSTASYFENEKEIRTFNRLNNEDTKLNVEVIYINDKTNKERSKLIIQDNAAGMDDYNFARAVQLNIKPDNTDGRNEFGMGLKTAAIWFGNNISIESVSIEDGVKRSTELKLKDLKNNQGFVDMKKEFSDKKFHGTRITVSDLANNFANKIQKRKLVETITTTYQDDITKNHIEIRFAEYSEKKKGWFDFLGNALDKPEDSKPVRYVEPTLLTLAADDPANKTGKEMYLKKEFKDEIVFDDNVYPIYGWIGILKTGNTHVAGFTLLRRGRVIIGVDNDDKYKPTEIFGASNSFKYQRLIGKINMDNFPIEQSKEAFHWNNGLKEAFDEKLKEISADYGRLASKIRKSTNAAKMSEKEYADNQEKVLQSLNKHNENVTFEMVKEEISSDKKTNVLSNVIRISNKVTGIDTSLRMMSDNIKDPDQWIDIKKSDDGNGWYAIVHMNHDFFKPYSEDPKFVNLIMNMAYAYALSYVYAILSDKSLITQRKQFNDYLEEIARMSEED